MLAHVLLPRPYAFDLSAVLLTVIAAIYVGFALNDGRPVYVALELMVAAFFILLVLGGLWLSPYLWPVGLVLHAIWDALHHTGQVRTRTPAWYPPVCVLVDLLLAGFLLVWL